VLQIPLYKIRTDGVGSHTTILQIPLYTMRTDGMGSDKLSKDNYISIQEADRFKKVSALSGKLAQTVHVVSR